MLCYVFLIISYILFTSVYSSWGSFGNSRRGSGTVCVHSTLPRPHLWDYYGLLLFPVRTGWSSWQIKTVPSLNTKLMLQILLTCKYSDENYHYRINAWRFGYIHLGDLSLPLLHRSSLISFSTISLWFICANSAFQYPKTHWNEKFLNFNWAMVLYFDLFVYLVKKISARGNVTRSLFNMYHDINDRITAILICLYIYLSIFFCFWWQKVVNFGLRSIQGCALPLFIQSNGHMTSSKCMVKRLMKLERTMGDWRSSAFLRWTHLWTTSPFHFTWYTFLINLFKKEYLEII